MTSAPWVVVEGERLPRRATAAPADATAAPTPIAAPFASLGAMTWMESAIVQRRWIADAPETLAALGASFSVSGERVRQVEARLLVRLRFELADPAHPLLRLLRPSQRAAALAAPVDGRVHPLVAPFTPEQRRRLGAAAGVCDQALVRLLKGGLVKASTRTAVEAAIAALSLPVTVPPGSVLEPSRVTALRAATGMSPVTIRSALAGGSVRPSTVDRLRRAAAARAIAVTIPDAPPADRSGRLNVVGRLAAATGHAPATIRRVLRGRRVYAPTAAAVRKAAAALGLDVAVPEAARRPGFHGPRRRRA